MTQHHYRAPQYPVIFALGGSVFSAGSRRQFEVVVEKELDDSEAYKTGAVIDSAWEGFGYYPEPDVISPLCIKKDWTKKELVNVVNMRANRQSDRDEYPSRSLERITKQRLFKELLECLNA